MEHQVREDKRGNKHESKMLRASLVSLRFWRSSPDIYILPDLMALVVSNSKLAPASWIHLRHHGERTWHGTHGRADPAGARGENAEGRRGFRNKVRNRQAHRGCIVRCVGPRLKREAAELTTKRKSFPFGHGGAMRFVGSLLVRGVDKANWRWRRWHTHTPTLLGSYRSLFHLD